MRIIKLLQEPEWKERAARWFHEKWGIPEEAYAESIAASLETESVPSWYLCLDGERIAAGMGVIENDFHDRPDLAPNICAVYTEPEYRCCGLAGELLDYVCRDMAAQGISTLYLITSHAHFYERYGWEYLCMVQGDGDESMSRMYIHRMESALT